MQAILLSENDYDACGFDRETTQVKKIVGFCRFDMQLIFM